MSRPHAPALPAADQRRTGGAQDGTNGAAPPEAGLGKAGARTRAGGLPPPPSPPRRIDPLAADRAAPDAPGGRAADNRWQADARRGGRAKGGGAASPPPPPGPPPSLRATGATLRPPWNRGDPPLPQKRTRRGGGDAAGPAHRAPQRPQPPAPAGSAADGRAHTSAPERRTDQAWGRHTAAHQNSMGAAPPMTPPKTIAHSGRAEGGFRSEGAPGGAVHGLPLIPRPPGAAPRPRPNAHAGGVCADDKREARVGNRGPFPRGGAGRPRRDPPPDPPQRPASRRGASPRPPEAGGMVPPPPARERSRSRARLPAAAAGSHRNRAEQASPRQRARTPHRSRPEKAGEHEPERYGGHAPNDQNHRNCCAICSQTIRFLYQGYGGRLA